jgi:hypothetical protein
MRKADLRAVVTRREALIATARIGVAGFILGMKRRAGAKEQAVQLGAKVCILTPEAVEGPFYFDPKLVRSDITEGKRGAPFVLTLQTVEATTALPFRALGWTCGTRMD